MAIKVIKHGNKVLTAICPRCKCEFEFTNEDLKDYGNQIDWYEEINCPECHHRITWWYGEKSGRSLRGVRPYS